MVNSGWGKKYYYETVATVLQIIVFITVFIVFLVVCSYCIGGNVAIIVSLSYSYFFFDILY